MMALISQSFAAVSMPCLMIANTHVNAVQVNDDLDHSAHMMHQSQDEHAAHQGHASKITVDSGQEATGDCCSQNGACSMTGCSSLVVIVEPLSVLRSQSESEQITFYSNSFQSLTQNALFRPPILF